MQDLNQPGRKRASFISELRRRKVWLFGGVYLGLAWLLLQVAIAIESTLALPGWVDQVVLVFLVLGFPVALLLAWAHESTPDGEAVADPQTSATKRSEKARRPSVAVLPFDYLSDEPERAYFADGMTEDLITALSRFPWLFVISRGTSFSYKGDSVPAGRVARELGVRYIVEGCVRLSSSHLRVNAQLTDAESDRQIWAENFDRPTTDLFDLQDEISQAITGVLVPALSTAERESCLILRSNLMPTLPMLMP